MNEAKTELPTGHGFTEARGYTAYDWKGEAIKEQEPPDKMINVWVIEPHPNDSRYDSCVCRPYQQAGMLAKLAIEDAMDSANEETLKKEGVTVKVKLIQMRKDEYEGLMAED